MANVANGKCFILSLDTGTIFLHANQHPFASPRCSTLFSRPPEIGLIIPPGGVKGSGDTSGDLCAMVNQGARVREGLPVVWLTGLPGSGKTTIAQTLKRRLSLEGCPSEILDGDELRLSVSKDLGFSRMDRDENVHRTAIIAKYCASRGLLPIVALVSPFTEARKAARELVGKHFVEVFVACPLAVCMSRDPKGLYRNALHGSNPGMTGLDDPYESPLGPDATVRTDIDSVEACAEQILVLLESRNYVVGAEAG